MTDCVRCKFVHTSQSMGLTQLPCQCWCHYFNSSGNNDITGVECKGINCCTCHRCHPVSSCECDCHG